MTPDTELAALERRLLNGLGLTADNRTFSRGVAEIEATCRDAIDLAARLQQRPAEGELAALLSDCHDYINGERPWVRDPFKETEPEYEYRIRDWLLNRIKESSRLRVATAAPEQQGRDRDGAKSGVGRGQHGDHAKLQLALQDLTQREQLAGALCDGLFIDPRLAQVRQRCSCDDLRTIARVLAERITDAHELLAKAVKILDGLCNKDFEPTADSDEAFQRFRGRVATASQMTPASPAASQQSPASPARVVR